MKTPTDSNHPSISSRFGQSNRPWAKRLVSLTILLGSIQCLLAAPVDSTQAYKAAAGWLNLSPKPMGKQVGSPQGGAKAYTDANGKTLYYVVETAPSGFVVVAPDDELEPIVAFSPQSSFIPVPSQPLYDLLQKDMTKRLGLLHSAALKAAPSASSSPNPHKVKWDSLLPSAPGAAPTASGTMGTVGGAASIDDIRVAPMLETQWGQSTINDDPNLPALYNYYTPPYAAGNAHNYLAGCVATAWSQIMRFHQWPQDGVGTRSFSITVDNAQKTEALRGGDGAGGPYDWANMPPIASSSMSLVERQAIGALLHDAGVANNMAYTAQESGAWVTSTAIKSVFHYASAAACMNASDFSNAIQSSLDAGLPVHLAIYTEFGSGHAVVCDGYGYNLSTLYNHINLGWSGSSDAWYNLPLIDTQYTTFSILDQVIYNIAPSMTGEIISGRVLSANGSPLKGIQVTAQAGGLIYSATTNVHGMYVFKGMTPNTHWTITPYTAPILMSPTSAGVTTGFSSDTTPLGNRPGVDFQEPQGPGWLQVTLLPAGVSSSAQWQVDDNGNWLNSGDTAFLSSGVHRITFSSVPGWYPPTPQMVTVTKDQTTTASATYTLPWSLTLLSNPPEGGTVGAFPLPNDAGQYPGGAVVYLGSLPNSGYGFLNWTESGTVVSTYQNWQFANSYSDRNLTANFVPLQITAKDDQAYVAGKVNRVKIPVLANDSMTLNYYPLHVQSVTAGAAGSVAISPDGTLQYSSGSKFSGADHFTYTISDGHGEIGSANVTILDGFAGSAGSYAAILSGSGNSDTGYYSVNLTASGKLSAKLSVGGVSYSVGGVLGGDFRFQKTIKRPKQSSLVVTFQYDPVTQLLTGMVSSSDGAFSSSCSAYKVAFDPLKNPSALAGNYTVILPPDPALTGTAGPQGVGYLSLSLSPSGVVSAKGKLGDGTAISVGGFLESGNIFPLYVGLYGASAPYRGSLFGSITFHGNGTVSDYCDGTLTWYKPAQLTGAFYRNGFTATSNVIGSRYTAVTSGTPVVQFASGEADLADGNLPAPLTRSISLSPTNQVTVVGLPGDPAKLTLKITPATGSFTGSFFDVASRQTRTLSGVVLQKQGIAAGMFLGTDQSGSIQVK